MFRLRYDDMTITWWRPFQHHHRADTVHDRQKQRQTDKPHFYQGTSTKQWLYKSIYADYWMYCTEGVFFLDRCCCFFSIAKPTCVRNQKVLHELRLHNWFEDHQHLSVGCTVITCYGPFLHLQFKSVARAAEAIGNVVLAGWTHWVKRQKYNYPPPPLPPLSFIHSLSVCLSLSLSLSVSVSLSLSLISVDEDEMRWKRGEGVSYRGGMPILGLFLNWTAPPITFFLWWAKRSTSTTLFPARDRDHSANQSRLTVVRWNMWYLLF